MSNDTAPPGFTPINDPLGSPVAANAAPAGYQPIQDPVGDPSSTANPDYVAPTTGGGNGWTDVAKGAPQAIASGFNRGVLDLAGIPMDAATNIANLIKAGAGYVDSKITGKVPPAWSEPSDVANVPGTSAWLNKESAKPAGGSIVNVTGDPQSYILQGLHAMTEQTGPNALLPGSEEFARQAPPTVQTIRTPTAEENLAAQVAASKGNMGAAAASPSLAGVSEPLRQAVAKAQHIDADALARQIDADTLPQPEGVSPISLRAGSASGNDQQISLERNLRSDPATSGLLAKSISENDAKLGSSLGEIRRQATPDIVQRSNAEHGQAAIDAIKDQDNAAVKDIRAKYAALADQNGGAMPIDTGAAVGSIDSALSKGFLTKTAAEDPVISEVMENLRSGNPITFEQFENARTNLAAVQRSGTPAARAAAIVRNGLENMPLSEGAANLKGLADTARAAARTRFNTIEQNPAYEAAINDNVPTDTKGLHVIGAPSPQADTFMDRYFLGNGQSASRAYVARMQKLMQPNPDFSSAVEAASLNKLRKAAGLDENDEGSFRNASYRNARDAMAPKADVLMSPQSAQWTEQLKRVAGYENGVGKAGTVNYSNTAPALQQLAGSPSSTGAGAAAAKEVANHAADIIAAHTPGGVGLLGKRIGLSMLKSARDAKTAAAKLKFAQDATAPGAGIDRGAPVSAAGTRASGGRVDHEILVSRLLDRWHNARKAANKTTEPLLNFPDDTIQKALQIVGRAPV